MDTKYLISIIGKQSVDNQETETKLVAPCDYQLKNNNVYIVYEEYDNSDHEKKSLSTIKVDSESMVTLLRQGSQNTKLTLEKGKRHLCQYSTEFGDTLIGIFTHDINCEINKNKCKIILNYAIDVNTEHLSMNNVIIEVKENKNV